MKPKKRRIKKTPKFHDHCVTSIHFDASYKNGKSAAAWEVYFPGRRKILGSSVVSSANSYEAEDKAVLSSLKDISQLNENIIKICFIGDSKRTLQGIILAATTYKKPLICNESRFSNTAPWPPIEKDSEFVSTLHKFFDSQPKLIEVRIKWEEGHPKEDRKSCFAMDRCHNAAQLARQWA